MSRCASSSPDACESPRLCACMRSYMRGTCRHLRDSCLTPLDCIGSHSPATRACASSSQTMSTWESPALRGSISSVSRNVKPNTSPPLGTCTNYQFRKFQTARSRLYQSRFLRPNTHFSAFFELYKIHKPSHRSTLKNFRFFLQI